MRGGEPFFDSNVLLYLVSADTAKADRAEKLLTAGGVISVQVLNEIASVSRRKFGLSWPDLWRMLRSVRAFCRVEPLSLETHDRGMELAERYGYSVYDSLLIAAALDAGCRLLYSEDLQDGHRIGDLIIRNPFAAHRRP